MINATLSWVSCRIAIGLTLFILFALHLTATGDDWPRFRGVNGSGVAAGGENLSPSWRAMDHLQWKVALPGPGASSPIIVGQRVFVTCYSGYGVTKKESSPIEDLTRHLLCFDLKGGELLWEYAVAAVLPEDSYYKSGVSSHGYASHTPCSDGKFVYCFFGKGGVFAFSLDGQLVWTAEVGSGSDPPRWGSSSSPVLCGDVLIVTAAAESRCIIGFDKSSGRRLWTTPASGLDGMWGTPAIAKDQNGLENLVMMVPGEIWAMNPLRGTLIRYAEATESRQAYTSLVVKGSEIFGFSGEGSGSLSLQLSGVGDISEAGDSWRGMVGATYASPILHQSKLYVVSRGVLSVVDARTGERVQQLRLKNSRIIGNTRFGSLDYASPVLVGNRLLSINASGQLYVLRLGERVTIESVSEISEQGEVFWGTPALSDQGLIIRGSKHLHYLTLSGPADQSAGEASVSDAELKNAVSTTKLARQGTQYIDADQVRSHWKQFSRESPKVPQVIPQRPSNVIPQRPSNVVP
ncbi:PQQ-like beta-propeller repeat protein [bacterium]|nr:PQQ-binding-like beta-propeller repeat protein [Rubripirellula sp.]MDB4338810.1 PQQ-like beta-propeller repeat protein [Rubripirellula sp.]MDB4810141.1 PQQ-like beta-propeller repeat protein [bacterium]MDC0278640.1 PQQ-like beta-propeller repeat protein [bacterium]